jgi:hypothetical protein
VPRAGRQKESVIVRRYAGLVIYAIVASIYLAFAASAPSTAGFWVAAIVLAAVGLGLFVVSKYIG